MRYFDASAGLLDRSVFTSKELYAQEQGRIFRRCWLFVGPTNWVPRPYNYLSSSMGETPIIVWRGSQGELRSFVNRCVAGDGLIASKELGTAAELFCSCHGWRYGADGVVADHPHVRATPVAHLDSYKGLLFATLNPDAPTLLSYLGDFAWYLDVLLDRRAGGVEVQGGGAFRWMASTNWKVPAEAFAGDAYSDLTLHAATNVATDYTPPSRADQGLQISAGAGAFSVLTEPLLYTPSKIVQRYEEATAPETEARLGLERTRDFIPLVGTVFPNLSFDWRTRSLHVWHPRGPNQTEINTYCFVDCAAPDVVKEAMRKACQFLFGPAGLRSQDSIGPWQSLTERSGQMFAQHAPLNLQMGLGHELKRNIPGRVSDLFSEMNQRTFYGWWQTQITDGNEVPALSAMMSIAPPRAERPVS